MRTVQGSVREAARARRHVAFWEAALAIRQVLGTVHRDLLQLIVDRVQPPAIASSYLLMEHYQCSGAEASQALGNQKLVAALEKVVQWKAEWKALVERQRRAMEATGAAELTAEQTSARACLCNRGKGGFRLVRSQHAFPERQAFPSPSG